MLSSASSNQGSEYPSPPPQTVQLHGTSGFETIALSNLHQYYPNLAIPQKEYAYMKMAHIDFPLNDSLIKTVGPTLSFSIRFDATYESIPENATNFEGNDETKESSINQVVYMPVEQNIYIPKGVNVEFNVDLVAQNIKTIEQVAELVRRCISQIAMAGASDGNLDNDQSNPLIASYMQFISDFIYDGASQKFALQFNRPVSIQGVKLPLTLRMRIQGDQTGRAGKLLACIFGGQEFGHGWYSDFELDDLRSNIVDNGYIGVRIPIGGGLYKLVNDNEYMNVGTGQITTIDGIKKYRPPQTRELARLYTMGPQSEPPKGRQVVALSMFNQCQQYYAYSTNSPRMFVDPYIYIRGSLESNFWLANGQQTDILTTYPRTRPQGMMTTEQAFTLQSYPTRTSINSLRCMQIRITQQDGSPILIDDEYFINFVILFDKDFC